MKTKVHFLQTYIVLLSGIAATLLPVSCSQADSPSAGVTTDASTGETSRVEILIPRNLTRTYISDDEGEDLENDDYEGKRAVVEWNEGDQLVMWSKALTDGSELSEPATFTYLAPSFDEKYEGILFYCDNVEIPATLSTYSYYAVSPVPESMEGAKATYTVPAAQHGTFDEVPDIMRAEATAGRLMKDIRNPIDFSFEHVLHAMKITVPDIPFTDEGDGIKTLLVEFPYEVAGKLTVDAETGEAGIGSEGSKTITLTFDTPKKAGDTFWVVVAPAPNGGEGVTSDVHFTAANADGTQFTFSTPHEAGSGTFDFANLTGGRITPVKLHLTLRPQVDFEIRGTDHSRLGEPITGISSLTLPEGYTTPCLIPGTGNRTVTPTKKDNIFTIRMFADVVEELAQNGKPLSATVESAHAEDLTATGSVTASGSDKIFALTAPYLYAEDFSTTTQSGETGYYSTNGPQRSSPSWNNDLLSTGFPSGWQGGRCGVQQGIAVRIWGRSEHVGSTPSNFRGVLDSPTMSHLKAGATVKLKISFDYSMNREIEGPDFSTQHYFSVGIHQDDIDNIKSLLEHKTFALDHKGNGFNEITNITITAIGTDIYKTDFTGSHTHIDNHWEKTTGAICTRESRFAWDVYVNADLPRIAKPGQGWFGSTAYDSNYANMFLYLDNIKVSIVP